MVFNRYSYKSWGQTQIKEFEKLLEEIKNKNLIIDRLFNENLKLKEVLKSNGLLWNRDHINVSVMTKEFKQEFIKKDVLKGICSTELKESSDKKEKGDIDVKNIRNRKTK